MLSTTDRENIIAWAKYYIGNVTKQNNTNLCKGISTQSCCDRTVKIYMLIDLIECSDNILEENQIDNLYRRLQCLIDLTVSS